MARTSGAGTVVLVTLFFTLLHSCIGIDIVAPKYTHDLKIRYFTDATMYCDHMDLNISSNPSEVNSLSWIFPDGSLVTQNPQLDLDKYKLSYLNDSNGKQRIFGYALNVFGVDDDQFGYYTCIVTTERIGTGSGSSSGDVVNVIRWGLNVNGADFSQLLDEYKRDAIIGGIAAGVALVLILGACIAWHVFCNRDDDEYLDTDPIRLDMRIGDVSKNGMEMTVQDNSAYVVDDHSQSEKQNAM